MLMIFSLGLPNSCVLRKGKNMEYNIKNRTVASKEQLIKFVFLLFSLFFCTPSNAVIDVFTTKEKVSEDVRIAPETRRLQDYKDNFFSLATLKRDSSNVPYWHFKLGLKAPLLTYRPSEKEQTNRGIYFFYRMTGFWDIKADSGPFRDINHNPGLFWEQKLDEPMKFLDLADKLSIYMPRYEVGIEHISNGVDNESVGPGNTGVNRSRAIRSAVFFEPELTLSDNLTLYPRVWIPEGTSENSEIRDYWGYLWTTWSYKEILGLSLNLELSTRGEPWDEGSVDVRLYWGFDKIFGRESLTSSSEWHPSLFINYFDGRGDGLLDYMERRSWIRVGISFTPYAN